MAPVSQDAEAVDPLVTQTAQKLADVINDFRHQLSKRDGVSAVATGRLEFGLQSQIFELVVVPGADGDAHPITVHAKPKTHHSPASIPTIAPSAYEPTRRDADAELERAFVPRKQRKLAEFDDAPSERTRIEEDGESTSLITRADVNRLLAQLRDDIQEDTSECVNHVQHLLRRFRGDYHEKAEWEYEQAQLQQTRGLPKSPLIATGATPDAAFLSPGLDRDEDKTSIRDTIQCESKLLSHQVKWLEDCRKVGAEMHDEREETWRTSAAGFHDQQRRDREAFLNRMLYESGAQTQMMNEHTQT